MPTIYVEGQPYEVEEGQNLLHACLSLGFNLPYFCWHPAIGSIGACRQCAVKLFRNENDKRGKLVMACMEPARDGARISIDDPEAKLFRASVIEWLMASHPHDCPVCDEGGECHLQDMTVMVGHSYRHYRFEKRTFRNQNLGPFITHEMNRCIQCYRCVRYYSEYAGGGDLAAFGIRNLVYFGRRTDGPLESEFSGNLIEMCPTGVFDDKILAEKYTRKWDLQTAPSVCVLCAVGCNTIPGERYGELRRIRNRYNGDVNGYFLCDRGRFGWGFVNSNRRVRHPIVGRPQFEPLHPEHAHERAMLSKSDGLRAVVALLEDPARVIGIGSPRASLEANYALRALVGADRFYSGMSQQDHELVALAVNMLRMGAARAPSLRDLELADAMLILGEDLTNTAPMLSLSLRHWLRRRQAPEQIRHKIPAWNDAIAGEIHHREPSPLYVATSQPTKLDRIAAHVVRAAPDELARFGFAIAHALHPESPPVPDLDDELRILVETVRTKLEKAERPIIVSGVSSGSAAIMQAAANVAWAFCSHGKLGELVLVVPECNSIGLSLLEAKPLGDAFAAVRNGDVDTVIILENDLYRRAPARSVERFLHTARHVIVLDHLLNPTSSQAELILPVGTFAESSGTLINNEGRAQRFYQVFAPGDDIQASWVWLRDIMAGIGRTEGTAWRTLDDVIAALGAEFGELAPIQQAAPSSQLRIAGMRVARKSFRYSGRTAEDAGVSVVEPPPPPDPDTPLSYSMEGFQGQPPSALIPRFWAPGWNSEQSLNKFQEEVAGPLRGGDPGCRLFEPVAGSRPASESGAGMACLAYYHEVPAASNLRQRGDGNRAGRHLVIPLHYAFGSEELSMLTPGIAQRAPEAQLRLNAESLAELKLQEGDEVTFTAHARKVRLPVCLMPELPPYVAGLPVGLPGLGDLFPPFTAVLEPVRIRE